MKKLLSQAILDGCKRYPVQARKHYFYDDDSACALGTALAGEYGSEDDLSEIPYSHSELVLVTWPYSGCTVPVPPDPLGRPTLAHTTLADVVIYLNDTLHWGRKRIAEWVAEKERELGIEDPALDARESEVEEVELVPV